MKRLLAVAVLLSSLLLLPGCATLREAAQLRALTFEFAGVSDVRLVGIPIGPNASYGSLTMADVARLAAAALAQEAPLECVVHVAAANPAANRTSAKLAGLDWTLFVDEKQALAGGLAAPVAIGPGETGDVPLAVRLDLLKLGASGGRNLYDLALAIAGQGTVSKPLRLELVPTVQTSIGPITYPSPVVIRRGVK